MYSKATENVAGSNMGSVDQHMRLVILMCVVTLVQGYTIDTAAAATTVGLPVTVIVTLCILTIALLCAKKKSRPRRVSVNGTPPPASPPNQEIQLQNLTHQHIPDHFSFPRQNLTFLGTLGIGQYGVVHLADALGLSNQGHWIKTKVAIKTVKAAAMTSDKIDFLRELNVMKQLKPHRNVLGLLGCCIEKEPFLIMVEYMPNGNLLQLLIKSRMPGPKSITQRTLLMMAAQVADGMAFVARSKCIHRDLAARNILIGKDFLCKVSDFGRSCMGTCVIERGAKLQGPHPIRWMAIESLIDNLHTSAGDVWAFGVLLWEIATLGARPYAGMPPRQVILFLQQGYRMPRPQHCSPEVYDIMMSCWSTDPSRRPSFTQISEDIRRINSLDKDYVVIERIDRSIFDDRTFDPFEELDL